MSSTHILPALPLRRASSNPHIYSTGKIIGTLIAALGLGSIAWSTAGDLSAKRVSLAPVPQTAVERPMHQMYQWYRYYRTSGPLPIARHESADLQAARTSEAAEWVKLPEASTAR